MKKFLPKSINNPQGFTLVELLVVVSIIAILSVIGITLFGTAQKNARDARRRVDIDAIATALEAAYKSTDTKPYPAVTDSLFASGKVPTDPQGGTGYTLTGTLPGITYIYCATLENASGNATKADGTGIGSVTTGGFYCRQNQQ